MDIAYSSGDLYSQFVGVSMLSLFENNKDIERIRVFVTDLGISDENKDRLKQIGKQYGREIVFQEQSDELIRKFLGESIPDHYGNLATYGKLLAGQIYPSDVKRLLFIDADTLVVGSLKELDSIDMTDKVIAAAACADMYTGYNITPDKHIIDAKECYYNAGILLMDIENWEKFNYIEKIRDAVTKGATGYKDQSLINYAVADEHILRIPIKYNSAVHGYPRLAKEYWKNHMYPVTPEEAEEALYNPVIIHYKGRFARPWFKENSSDRAKEFYHYKAMSPFADFPLMSVFKDGCLKNQKGIKKAIFKFYITSTQTRFGAWLFVNRRKKKDANNIYFKRMGGKI